MKILYLLLFQITVLQTMASMSFFFYFSFRLSVMSELQIHDTIIFHEIFILLWQGCQVLQRLFYLKNVANSSFLLVT